MWMTDEVDVPRYLEQFAAAEAAALAPTAPERGEASARASPASPGRA
jgi:hypothetical protein